MSQQETDYFIDIINCIKDPVNWKLRTRYVDVNTYEEAQRIAKALNYFLGGSEITKFVDTDITLTGKIKVTK